jgi:hypothetical protein
MGEARKPINSVNSIYLSLQYKELRWESSPHTQRCRYLETPSSVASTHTPWERSGQLNLHGEATREGQLSIRLRHQLFISQLTTSYLLTSQLQKQQ